MNPKQKTIKKLDWTYRKQIANLPSTPEYVRKDFTRWWKSLCMIIDTILTEQAKDKVSYKWHLRALNTLEQIHKEEVKALKEHINKLLESWKRNEDRLRKERDDLKEQNEILLEKLGFPKDLRILRLDELKQKLKLK